MDFHQVEPFAKSLLRFLESSHFSRPKPHGQFTDLMRCDRQRRICARFKRVTERSYYSSEFAPRVDEAGTRVRRQQRIEATYIYRRPEERRGWEWCCSTCTIRWSPVH